DRSAYERLLRRQMSMMRWASLETRVLSVTVEGDEVVSVLVENSLVQVVRFVFVRVWLHHASKKRTHVVRTSNGWRTRRIEILEQVVARDPAPSYLPPPGLRVATSEVSPAPAAGGRGDELTPPNRRGGSQS